MLGSFCHNPCAYCTCLLLCPFCPFACCCSFSLHLRPQTGVSEHPLTGDYSGAGRRIAPPFKKIADTIIRYSCRSRRLGPHQISGIGHVYNSHLPCHRCVSVICFSDVICKLNDRLLSLNKGGGRVYYLARCVIRVVTHGRLTSDQRVARDKRVASAGASCSDNTRAGMRSFFGYVRRWIELLTALAFKMTQRDACRYSICTPT